MDNLRFDQFKIFEPLLQENFRVENEDLYCSIIPTATQYCRNALFAGLTPLEIRKRYPKYWKEDNEEGGKNMYEEALFEAFLKRNFCRYQMENTIRSPISIKVSI